MRKINLTVKLFLYFILLSLIIVKSASAYIDPGTGSYLFQIIAASVLTVLFSFKSLVKFIRTLIKKLFTGKS